MTFNFPVGYHDLHTVKIIDYQLNRWHSLGYARLEDVKWAGSRIRTFDDWKGVMKSLAEKAAAEERWVNAAFYFRAAEFFVLPGDPDKEMLYDRFIDLFYNKACAFEPIERHAVPYEGTYIPALHIPPERTPEKGTIVIHGGFDSFIEGMVFMCHVFCRKGVQDNPVRRAGSGRGPEKVRPPVNARMGKADKSCP